MFIFWGRQIDELYARASRWLLQEPYLWAYADRKHDDVRGYYYLSRVLEVEEKLLQWKNLSQETQTQYQTWLEGLCFNGGGSSSECREEFQETIQKIGHPKDFYLKYLPKGQVKWAGLFNITQKRDDIIWKGEDLKTLKTPFTQPESEEVKTFLSENIEDEWKWKDWRLNLNFISGGFDTTHIEFVPGATPHVNGLAGSTITMDANQPLTEYHVRWTIRHEFGHTLGFPDCYVEFYDTDKAVMISYQLDTTNLMCSRRGKLQEKHYEELKRVYYTP